MTKKSLFFCGLILLICITMLAGCSAITATGSQQANTPPQSTANLPVQSATPTSPSTSVAATTPASGALNAVINIPSFADLLDVAEHSVVKIDITLTTTTLGRTVQAQGAGSGWIIDSNGTIVTNNHVVDGADSITVTTLDGKTYNASVINSDPANDLALVKITPTSSLPGIKTGDASKLRTGDWVLAIGNPLGEGIIASEGIVSRLGVTVSLSPTETYNNLIETTAAINPGNSGGPLVNMAGEVIGITTLGASGYQGMGYAISMTNALPIIQKLSGK